MCLLSCPLIADKVLKCSTTRSLACASSLSMLNIMAKLKKRNDKKIGLGNGISYVLFTVHSICEMNQYISKLPKNLVTFEYHLQINFWICCALLSIWGTLKICAYNCWNCFYWWLTFILLPLVTALRRRLAYVKLKVFKIFAGTCWVCNAVAWCMQWCLFQ